jgi:phospholipid/cholesterol/gamma-HCH transport system ATP-binding protein
MSDLIKSIKFEKVTIGLEGKEVLQACDFDFPMHQNCRIVFKNDKDKFCFFHAVTQVQGFENGRYLINGEDVTQFSFEEFLPYRLKIGFGFSTRGLIHNQTLRQNLELPLRFHKFLRGKALHLWLAECVEYFELREDLDRRPAEVSPSSQKATLILRAFLHKT